MMEKRLKIVNVIGVIIVIAVNAFANYLPLNGFKTGEISAIYPNLFTPADFTFSIWIVIYLGLLVFAFYQFKIKTERKDNAVKLIGLWFLVSCILNAAWLFAWHYQQLGLSVLIMLNLLVSLIIIYRNLGIGLRPVEKSEKYAVHAPFSLYLGWITVATIANISAYLVSINWQGWGLPHDFWTALMIFAVCIIGISILRFNLDIFYVSVILWAYTGLIAKQFSLENQIPVVITTIIACALILIVRFIKLRNNKTVEAAYF